MEGGVRENPATQAAVPDRGNMLAQLRHVEENRKASNSLTLFIVTLVLFFTSGLVHDDIHEIGILIGVLLFHELGHLAAMKILGYRDVRMFFVPFLGAVIAAKSMGRDAAAEARVGLAGPVLGSIATLIPLAVWLATGSEFWRALAYVGFLINLFNLLPVLPLDGGRAMAALSPWIWAIGFAGLIALVFVFPNPIFFLVLIFGGLESWRRFRLRNTPEARAYHAIPSRTRALVAATYLGLAGLLGVGVAETFFARGL